MSSLESKVLGDFLEQCGAFSPNIPVLVKKYGYPREIIPMVSFIVPVHNQEQIIANNLHLLKSHSLEVHEIVIIVDGCTDQTNARIESWITEGVLDNTTIGVTVATIQEGVFETICDSIGARLSVGDYLIEVQADMSMTEPGFDRVLLAALSAAPELVAVSGRGAHTFSQLRGPVDLGSLRILDKLFNRLFTAWARRVKSYTPSSLEMHLSDQIGRVSSLIDFPAAVTDRRRVYVHETVMRGPLAIARNDFEMLNGLDTQHFFLGNDDHDLAMRALTLHGRRVGYTPIGFDSPIEAGSTRTPRSPESKKRYEELQHHYNKAFAQSALAMNLDTYQRPKRYSLAIQVDS